MNLIIFFDLRWICSQQTPVSSFYKENNFKACLTKQLLNMFKLWCERSIRQFKNVKAIVSGLYNEYRNEYF